MIVKKRVIKENIQNSLETFDWQGAIIEMEKLFRIDGDPHVRIRIGDLWRKLNCTRDAIWEYLYAAELFARQGFVEKAKAQYKLALRLDASNKYAQEKLLALNSTRYTTCYKREPVEYSPHAFSRTIQGYHAV